MENYSLYSYATAALANIFLLPMALLGFKKNPVAIPVIIAALFSLCWSAVISFTLYNSELFTSEILPVETLRNAGWLFLLSVLISRQQFSSNYVLLLKSRLAQGLIVFVGFIFILEAWPDFRYQVQQFVGQDFRLVAHVLFAIMGLMMVEQLYRNSSMEMRWALKFLCLG
ncbi:MAG: PEP-CTERM system histidine kinase PrsK, partial [Methylococcales bacterium]|nr:PEP-CTERM system histidine kinase PrsK [Methylococcales bacterium]